MSIENTKNYCVICKLSFKRSEHLERHKNSQKHVKNTQISSEIKDETLLKAKKKISGFPREMANLKKYYRQKIEKINNEHQEEIDNLQAQIRDLSRKLEQEQSDNSFNRFIIQKKVGGRAFQQYLAKHSGIHDFGNEDYAVILETNPKLISDNLGRMLDGDLEIVREIYINGYEPNKQPIRLVDFARKKIVIHKQGKWIPKHVRYLARIYTDQIIPLFQAVLREKDQFRYKLIEKYKHDPIELAFQEALFKEMWDQKNKHYLYLCTDRYFQELINGLTSLFGDATK